MLTASGCGSKSATASETVADSTSVESDSAIVYFIKDITPENVQKIYEALGRKAEGKVAVKLSTGEPGNDYHLDPALIGPLVKQLGATIVENNTAYNGGRDDTEGNLKAAADHGFTAIAPVVILDAEGQDTLTVNGGKHLTQNFVGSG